jgi:3-methyladenine DNA glycosylase AlkC
VTRLEWWLVPATVATVKDLAMPEPFKNFYSLDLIQQMGGHLARVESGFDVDGFIRLAAENLEQNELKQRAAQIRVALNQFLPDDFGSAVEIMLASLHPDDNVDLSSVGMDADGVRGWAVMPMSELVGLRCQENFDLAMQAQHALTKRFSSEFGIRYSILADPERAMETILGWTRDENYHVRRLASEGSRPRLPWAMQLPMFMSDPGPVLPVLEALKDDESAYVRRSVANNVNDIAKDNPDIAGQLARNWMQGADKTRQKTVRHACRTLIKQGHPGALEALGFGEAEVEVAPLRVTTPKVAFGNALEFETVLVSTASKPQNLVIDYVVHFLKANGRTAPKTFKLKTAKVKPGERLVIKRRHAIRPITTRRYYNGEQAVEVQINGKPMGITAFELSGV